MQALAMIMASACCFLLAACNERTGDGSADVAPGISVLHDSRTGGASPEVLQSMRWVDIAPTFEVCLRNELVDFVMVSSAGLTEVPVVYLRGLLMLSMERAEEAHCEWAKLEVDQIPGDFLYPPWRLAMERQVDNRYAEALRAAVEAGEVGDLVRARWNAAHLRWAESLEDYFKTDPAGWTPHDAMQFGFLKLNGPTRREAEMLLAGALRGGRVPQALRGELARLIREEPVPDMEAMEASLRAQPALAAAAVEAASIQLALRQAFASNQFEEVLAKVRDLRPLVATDETVLLVFLSAVQIGESSLARSWSNELYRRNPTPETAQWIEEIRKSAP